MDTDNGIRLLKDAIDGSKNICLFTGAGFSCPSGIPDFRSADGLYNAAGTGGYSPEEIVSHEFFFAHTREFYDFYIGKMIYPDALPNAAHLYFAGLEREGKNVAVVTQNIDGLHQDAGSTNVIELHGSVRRNRCLKCGKAFGVEYILTAEGAVPRCDACGGIIKPDVVLYGEPLDGEVISAALQAISAADLMIVAGTSLTVYPAASFVGYFRGKTLAVINKSPVGENLGARPVINGDVAETARRLSGM